MADSVRLFDLAILDSAGTAGPTIVVSQPVEIGPNNTAQLDVKLLVQTATSTDFQAEVSNDAQSFSDKGSAKTFDAIGFHPLTADSAITARYVRYSVTLTGSGKAIFSGDLHLSNQS